MRALGLIAALTLSFHAFADVVQLRADAPDRHVVVKGDTLWDISEKFLNTPWKWPELWRLNQEQIRNPHLIYPGDVVYLTWQDGKPMLSTLHSVKLSPEIRAEAIPTEQAISTVPYTAIAPFLRQARVIEDATLTGMPRVLGANDGRVMYSTHDALFASAGDPQVSKWQFVRLGRPLVDPASGVVLGHELDYLGEGKAIENGAVMRLKITSAEKEIMERDRLVPAVGVEEINLVPRPPETPIDARVIRSLQLSQGAGRYETLVLNKGADDGLALGHVLALYRPGRPTADPKCLRADKIAFLSRGLEDGRPDCDKKTEAADTTTLPDHKIGDVFVYRVFGHLAFALVMSSTEPIYPNSLARNP